MHSKIFDHSRQDDKSDNTRRLQPTASANVRHHNTHTHTTRLSTRLYDHPPSAVTRSHSSRGCGARESTTSHLFAFLGRYHRPQLGASMQSSMVPRVMRQVSVGSGQPHPSTGGRLAATYATYVSRCSRLRPPPPTRTPRYPIERVQNPGAIAS